MGTLRRLFGRGDRVKGTSSRTNLRQVIGPGRGRSQQVLDRFYELQTAIEESQRQRHLDRALDLSDESASMLASFVDAWREEERKIHGGRLPEDWFRIRSIICVETICRLAPARRDHERLERLRQLLQEVPELEPWLEDVSVAFDALAVAEQVAARIEGEPGVRQANLARALEADGTVVRQILYWMEADGQIERRKAGSTYELYPVRSRS